MAKTRETTRARRQARRIKYAETTIRHLLTTTNGL